MMTGLDVIEPGLYASERCLEEKWLEKSSSPAKEAGMKALERNQMRHSHSR
jgi:hypothetical protein